MILRWWHRHPGSGSGDGHLLHARLVVAHRAFEDEGVLD
jgi:hypothetical protein